MPSADFCPLITPTLDGVSQLWQTDRPPRVLRTHFPPIHPSHLLPPLPDDYRASGFMPPRPGAVASYALRVPRAGGLPAASFRPRLAAVALAVQLTVPVIRVRRGLSPPSECALPGAHRKGATALGRNPFI